MQQADRADSIGGTAPSGGNSSHHTGPARRIMAGEGASAPHPARVTFDLIEFPLDEWNGETDAASDLLVDAQLLLSLASETASEAADERGYWYRDIDYHRKRLARVESIILMAIEKVNDAQRHYDRSDQVMTDAQKARRGDWRQM